MVPQPDVDPSGKLDFRVTKAEADRLARHIAFVEGRNRMLRQRRQARALMLGAGATRTAHERALGAWEQIGIDQANFVFRRGYVSAPEGVEEPDKPPLARLASRRGRPLRLHLAALAYAGTHTVAGKRFQHDPDGLPIASTSGPTWAKLAGVYVPGTVQRATQRLHEALITLHREGLVARPSSGRGWQGFSLRQEDDADLAWTAGQP